MRRGAWGTRLGFYLAAIGSAFGLGNLWRFPYVVAENGGGAFVLLYVLLVFLIGMPFLIGELILGKATRSSLVLAIRKLNQRSLNSELVQSGFKYSEAFKTLGPILGYFSLLIALLVLAYYAVISGWVMHYLVHFSTALIRDEGFNPSSTLTALLSNGWLQLALTSAHLLIVMIVVAKDVEEGIERWVGYMMPVFGLFMFILAYHTMSLESSGAALRYLLYPDFSKLSVSSLGQALGHVFFTLSVGFGTMVTFGSYLRDKAYTPMAGFRVATVDSLISVFAGMVIFPLVLISQSPVSGPDMLFQTVPSLFDRMPGGIWFGIGFFICLYLAALGACIGLLETIVSNLSERLRITRVQAAIGTVGICFVAAILPALSTSTFSGVQWGDKGLLELLDSALINWCLPIAALAISQVVCYVLKEDIKKAEFADPESISSMKLYSHWVFVLKWLASPLIVIALILQLVGLLRSL